jgi:hypothetical protein
VRQHWYKNPEATQKMEQMAAGSEEEDWEQYAQ